MQKYLISILMLILGLSVAEAQTYKPISKLSVVRGKVDTATTRSHVIVGLAPQGSQVFVNKEAVKVYKTGSFGYELRLNSGNNRVEIECIQGEERQKISLDIFYRAQPKPLPPADWKPEQLALFPAGKQVWIMEGEPLQISVVSKKGSQLSWYQGEPLHEMALSPSEQSGIGKDRSLYQGYRLMHREDMAYANSPQLMIADSLADIAKAYSIGEVRVLLPERPLTVRSKAGAFLNESWGGDRLGGSKINFLDSGICMQVIGKADGLFKVRLAPHYTAYIPEAVVELLPEGNYPPKSLSGSWTVDRSGKFDVLSIGLPARHPYTLYQEVEPNRLVVDLYGVSCNTNWITNTLRGKEIERFDIRQIAPEVMRVSIDLKDDTAWGFKVEYVGTSLRISIKHKPDLSKLTQGDWAGLTFAVDAGHGGMESRGAVSPAGYMEKDQNFAMARMLKEMLEKRGAKVVLTRPQDKDVKMDDRKAVVRKAEADFLVSIHCNAGGNPLRTGGTSTYYKYVGYQGLSTAILPRLLELPVQNFGNIGHFNFSLNGVTDCPSVLVETLFMSSLEDEERVVDPVFQRKMMEKVMLGIEDFLNANR